MIKSLLRPVARLARRLTDRGPDSPPGPDEQLREHLSALREELRDLRARLGVVADLQRQLIDRAGASEGSLAGVWQEMAQLKQDTIGLRETCPGLWWKPNVFEVPVGIALRDLCRPGGVAFDCGANIGGLSVLMSRLVGPRGVVCAFEASPRVLDECMRNLVANGCGNVTAYHAAVFHTSDRTVPLYYGHHNTTDSLVAGKPPRATGEEVPVPTLALDDFVGRTGLVPDVVKMDIEEAEYDAVRGMLRAVESARPHLILETGTRDDRCLRLLRGLGYVAVDLSNYREVRGLDDFPADAEWRNLLYVHESRLDEVGYRPPFEFADVARVSPADFDRTGDGSLRLRNPVPLAAGRYAVEVDASAGGRDNQMACGVRSRGDLALVYWANTAHLFKSYRDWVFCLAEPSPAELFFEFQGGTADPTFAFRGAVVRRLPRFDFRPHPRVV